MKTMTIKGVPDALYLELRRRAKAHRRSLNSEVLVSLEQLLPLVRVDAGEQLSRLDRVREQLKLPYLSDAELNEARRDGRA